MRALVTGANGFLGSFLSQRLVEQGHFVRCLVRKTGIREGLPESVEVVEGDVCEPESLQRAMKDVTVVFHLAGIRRAPSKDIFLQVNAEGTRHVCEAMVQSATAKRLVLCGSLAASGPSSGNPPRTEDEPFQPQEWYGESKALAEQIALGFQKALEVSVIRPARILGPKDKENLVFFKLVKKGLCLKIGGGPRPLSLVDVEDVVSLMLLLAARKEAIGESFFCAADGTTTLEDLQKRVASALNVHCRTLFIPAPVLRGLAATADVVSQLSGRHLPLNRKLARQLLAPGWTCSNAKARKLLGFSPRVSIEDSIRTSAAWYLSQGWLT